MASPLAKQRQQPAEAWRIMRWRSRHWAHREPLAEGVALTMLRIPAGSFEMGAPKTEAESSDRERPVHRVTLGEFLLGQTPVTKDQWWAVAQWQRLEQEDRELWPDSLDPDPVAELKDPERFRGEQRPVVNVSWHDAMAFCQRLRLRTGMNYTLPSEAQWEYACRAGTTTPFHWGATISTELANYNGTKKVYGDGEKGLYRHQTLSVASFPANPWGLHDMHGNVWEWCADHWHDNYKGAPGDGRAWIDEESKDDPQKSRLVRGGSWFFSPAHCRSAYRYDYRPDSRFGNFGFRVCCLPQDYFFTH